MNMENFHNSTEVALKFGFIGIGQGGGKIVDAFAGIKTSEGKPLYETLAVNTFPGDLAALKNVPQDRRVQLRGWEKGSGGNPDEGYKALVHDENRERVLIRLEEVAQKSDALFIVASYGGGTGTGGHGELINWANQMGKPVGAIVTLPRKGYLEELENALSALTHLVNNQLGLGAKPLKSLILLDNEKLYRDFLVEKEQQMVPEDADWLSYSNRKLSSILHDLNVLATGSSDISIDGQNLFNVLFSGGCLALGQRQTKEDNSDNSLSNEVLQTIEGNNPLSDGFDFRKTVAGLYLAVTKNGSHLINNMETLSDELKTRYPGLGRCHYRGYVDWAKSDQMLLYTLMCVRSLPERARNLVKEFVVGKKEEETFLASINDFAIEADVDGFCLRLDEMEMEMIEEIDFGAAAVETAIAQDREAPSKTEVSRWRM
ncbi:hypothetical protein GJ688_08285 [Heliobacillus mobilis]|uniref:Tubulin/FtsZ GTPase domain-containing protein n=1 Tax=Heliobacterium mobile TaxID=28064 RepID=A0A6I3SJI9_HELMO|nr:hypothetical protein [Heliobacterium mobile]MTV48976.1 hypothetical protein [Heliobacterium mobile]